MEFDAGCFNIFLLFVTQFLITSSTVIHNKSPQNWINHGGDIYNRRFASTETKISSYTAPNLTVKWEFYARNDISATPAIYDGILYFPSWNGFIYAVKASDGSLLWKKELQQLTGLNRTISILNVTAPIVSRSTPTVARDNLIIGIYGPAVVIAVKRTTGDLIWSTSLDIQRFAIITMSGTYHKRGFYVGTSSLEESSPIETCCTFQGRFVRLNPKTGALIWQTIMLPYNHNSTGEYAGAAIWGSSPSVDVKRNLVFIATGNLYSVPQNVRDCQEMKNNQTVPSHRDRCVEPENLSDSMIAMDLNTGVIKWYRQLGGYDVWFFACNDFASNPNCPPGPNPDADFGESPMMLTVKINGTKKDIVVAVQKSGFTWALDRDNGSLIWSTKSGPGGSAGGGTWGAATDKKRIYTNIANSGRQNFTLSPFNTTITTAGGWVAMEASTGKILWSTADPSNETASGPVTVANGVVFAGSVYGTGPVYAVEARTGNILWSRETGASVYGGVSVSDGCIYIGSGYRVSLGAAFASFTAGTSLFAFCV